MGCCGSRIKDQEAENNNLPPEKTKQIEDILSQN